MISTRKLPISKFLPSVISCLSAIGSWRSAVHPIQASSKGIPLEEAMATQGPPLGVTYAVQHIEPLILGAAMWLLVISGIILFLCVTVSGLQWILSQGDTSSIETSRSRLANCLIGLAIVSLALAIFYLVQYFFGLDIFPTP